MYVLEIDIIYLNIINYLDLIDYYNFSRINKKNYCKFNNNKIWKIRLYEFLNNNNKIVNYKNQYFMKYFSTNKNLCSICFKPIIKNFYISYHNCNYGFKNCIKCLKQDCICDDSFVSYHSDCLDVINNTSFKCPLCNRQTIGYKIFINI